MLSCTITFLFTSCLSNSSFGLSFALISWFLWTSVFPGVAKPACRRLAPTPHRQEESTVPLQHGEWACTAEPRGCFPGWVSPTLSVYRHDGKQLWNQTGRCNTNDERCCAEGCLGIPWRKFNVLINRTVLALSETVIVVLCHGYADTSGAGKCRDNPGVQGWNFCITSVVFCFGGVLFYILVSALALFLFAFSKFILFICKPYVVL